MRAVVQRVKEASVSVAGEEIGKIGRGFMVLLGVEEGDTQSDVEYIVDKVANLRVFEDSEGKMNLPPGEVGGGVLLVSQFTLLGDCRKGRRPSFVRSAPMDVAEKLYGEAAGRLRAQGLTVETGKFRAEMDVSLINEGPVTILLDSRKVF